jgi:hypothetical protein
MQTMRNPQLLPCGHIADKESIIEQKMCRYNYLSRVLSLLLSFSIQITFVYHQSTTNCFFFGFSLDREPFRASDLIEINPRITKLAKGHSTFHCNASFF